MSGYGHEVRAQADELRHTGHVAGVVAARAGELAAGPDARDGLAHQPPHLARPGVAHALAQVSGGDVEHVHARHGQDFVQVLDSLGLLDHAHHKGLLVHVARGLITPNAYAVVVGAPATHAAMALRVVARGPRDAVGLLARVHVRDYDALQSPGEKAQNGRVAVVGYACDGRYAERLGGPRHVLHLGQRHGAVLAIDHHEVEAHRTE